MRVGGPPTFAWDWLARQRLPWQEARRRLMAEADTALAERYAASDARHDVMALLRADHPVDERVRTVLDAVIVELVFLGRVDVALSERGVATPPRGLRWWHEHLSGGTAAAAGAAIGAGATAVPPAAAGAGPAAPSAPDPPRQLALALDDVLAGYGDPAVPFGPDRTRTGSEPDGSDAAVSDAGAHGADDGTEAVA